MAELKNVRVQLLDETTGAVIEEVNVVTAPSAVLFSDGKNLTQKLEEIVATSGKKGDTGATGPKGDPGTPFQIKKIYTSVAQMTADHKTTEVKVGEFVCIETGNVSNADNSKLYIKTATDWSFVTDLSGSQGLQGPQGGTGPKGADGKNGVDGQKGDTGATGPKGADGRNGIDGKNGVDGDNVKVGTTLATAAQRKLFFKVV